MSPLHRRLILSLTLIPAGLAHAQTPAPTPEAKPAPPYELKNKSSFTSLTEEQRAPFWPIGWSKRRPIYVSSSLTHQDAAPRPVIDEKSFKLTSILLGSPSLAIINGRTYSEGEFMRQPKVAGAATAATAPGAAPAGPRIRLYRIADGSVILQAQDQLVTIPLQRPELVQRSNVEELLSEDRP